MRGVKISDVHLARNGSHHLTATRLAPMYAAVFVHGGGTVAGSRCTQLPSLIRLVSRVGFVAYSIE